MLSVREQSAVLIDLANAAITDGPVPCCHLLSQTLPLAKKNDIYFYVLSLLCSESGKKGTAGVEKEYATLYAKKQYVEREVGRVSQFFAARELPVFFIKDFMRYPYIDHDVDFVAVRKSSMEAYNTGMNGLGYRYRFGKSQLREPDKYFYYLLNPAEGFADIKFHLHKALSWNGVVFLDAEDVLARCREEQGASGSFLVPGYEDEIMIMAAHAIFENAYIRAGEILQFGLIAKNEKISWEYLIDIATRRNWQAGLAFFLEVVFTTLSWARKMPDAPHVRTWTAQTLSHAGIPETLFPKDIVWPYEIPYAVCMRLYMDKMKADFRGRTLNIGDFLWEGLSFMVFVWLMRLKKRLG